MSTTVLRFNSLVVATWLSLSITPIAVAADHALSAYVTGGMNSSWLSPEHDQHGDFTGTTNPSVGLLADWQPLPGPALEAGLVVERRGTSWFSRFAPDGNFADDDAFERRLDLVYGSVPVRVREQLPLGRAIISLHGGLEASYLLRARQITTVRRTEERYAIDRNVRDQVPAWEIAATLGTRLGTKWHGREVFLDVGYVHGLVSAGTESATIESGFPRLENRLLRFSLGVSL